MDFTLTEEQAIFRDSVSRFLNDEYSFAKRQRILASEAGFRAEHWQTFAELGWLAVPFPEEYGGLDGSPVEVMLLMEQFGRGLMCSPYVATVVLGTQAILLGGNEEQKRTLLPAIAEGRLKLAVAFAELQSRYSLENIKTKALRDGGGFRLSGTKSAVFYGGAADKFIVSARTSGEQCDQEGISLFLVDANAPGVNCQQYPTQDGGRASSVRLDNVRVDSDAIIATQDDAFPLLEQVIDHGIAAVCAEAIGSMWAVYEQTLAYVKTRKQFGQALGSFQAIQHRLVDVYMKCELAQSMVYEGTLNLETDDPKCRQQCVSAAKYEVGKYARDVGEEGVQLHGGIGVTMDLPIGHYLKRLTLINLSFGDPEFHLRRYQILSQR